MEDVLSGYYVLSEWKPELIEEVMEYIKPNNIR